MVVHNSNPISLSLDSFGAAILQILSLIQITSHYRIIPSHFGDLSVLPSMKFNIILLFVIATEQSDIFQGNILTFSPIGGSHMFFMLEVSKVLSNQGFNVTMVSLSQESRASWNASNNRLHVITVPPMAGKHPLFSTDLIEGSYNSEILIEDCTAELLSSVPTDQVMADTLRVEACSKAVLSFYRQSLKFFTSNQWQSLLNELDFKAIVAEERGVWAALLGARNIPMIMVTPELSHILPKLINNLPIMFSREPGVYTGSEFEGNVGFIRKVLSFISMAGQIPFAFELEDIFRPHLNNQNVSSLRDLSNLIDVFFVNDVTSFSFPFLLPSSVVNMGTIGFSNPIDTPLPPHILSFLKKGTKQTIYLSFGSYSTLNKFKRKMYQAFIRAANESDIKIILSTGGNKDQPGSFIIIIHYMKLKVY